MSIRELQSPWPARMVYLVVTILGAAALPMMFVLYSEGCTAPDRSREALLDLGFVNISIGDHAWFACAKDDDYATLFQATTPQGRRVSGAVCCGVLKSCTVRFDR